MSILRGRVTIPWVLLLLVFLSTFLAACQPVARLKPLAVGTELLVAAYLIPASVTTSEVAPVVTTTEPLTTAVTATPGVTATAPVSGAVTALPAGDPALYAANAPVALSIPALDLEAPVVPMGWEPALIGDQVTTRWIVPLDAVGWAVNSAGAGDAGNLVMIGQQALGAGLLRSIALGEIEGGQEILVTAADGKIYVYKVSEETPPIPAIGATPAETARAAAYLEPGDTAKLTLVTGWPADTSTHRIFVVADYVETQP